MKRKRVSEPKSFEKRTNKRRKLNFNYDIDLKIHKLREEKRVNKCSLNSLNNERKELFVKNRLDPQLLRCGSSRGTRRIYSENSPEYRDIIKKKKEERKKRNNLIKSNKDFCEKVNQYHAKRKEFRSNSNLLTQQILDLKVKRSSFIDDLIKAEQNTTMKESIGKIKDVHKKYGLNCLPNPKFEEIVNIIYKYYIRRKLFLNAGLLDDNESKFIQKLKKILNNYKFKYDYDKFPGIKIKRNGVKYSYTLFYRNICSQEFVPIIILGLHNMGQLKKAIHEIKICIEGQLILEARRKIPITKEFVDCKICFQK